MSSEAGALNVTANPANFTVRHDVMANAIRLLAIDSVAKAKVKSGHQGMPIDWPTSRRCAHQVPGFSPTVPRRPDRDRFILAAGAGSMLQYATLCLVGYPT